MVHVVNVATGVYVLIFLGADTPFERRSFARHQLTNLPIQ